MSNGLKRRTINDPSINELLNNITDFQTKRAIEELIAKRYLISSLPSWDDIRVGGSTAKVQGNQNIPTYSQLIDDGSSSTGVYAHAFADDELQQLFFEIQIPHRYMVGSDLEFHIHWVTATGNAGNALWGIEYWPSNPLATPIASATTIVEMACPALPVAYEQNICELAGIPGSELTESSILSCGVYRDPTNELDTLTGSAFLLSMDFHFLVNKPGTLTEYRN